MVNLSEWNNLAKAAEYLSEKTGKTWDAQNVLDLVVNRVIPVCYAVAPEGAFDTATSKTRGVADGPLIPDGLFPLSQLQSQCFRIREHATITSVQFPKAEFWTDEFKISIGDVRIRADDLERYAKSPQTEQPAEQNSGADGTDSDSHTQHKEEPPMKVGTNLRKACKDWCAYMATRFTGATREELAEKIKEEADRRRYMMQGGSEFSIDMIVSAIPKGTTGTLQENRNGGKRQKTV
jgi:hypothetical protein